MAIHETAVVDASAELASDIEIGPYAVIGAGVSIGSGCVIHGSCHIYGSTVIGRNNEIYPYAVIGCDPADKKYAGENSQLIIGDGNVFRESVSIHRGTTAGGNVTKIGNNGWFMAHTHIAHDCAVGDDVVMANYSGLSGHVTVDDKAIIGFGVHVMQHCRIGYLAMIGGGSDILKDILPFGLVSGSPGVARAFNKIGMGRNDYSKEQIRTVHNCYKILLSRKKIWSEKVAELKQRAETCELASRIVQGIEMSVQGLAISAYK